jgi:capsular exopolysaccharide synthesis family protein
MQELQSQQQSNNVFNTGIAQNKLTPYEQFLKYLYYLPLLAISLGVSILLANIYVRYQEPVFKSSTAVLVKSDKENSLGTSGNSNSDDLLQSVLFGNKSINIDNEIELLKSNTLLKKVVEKNNFNFSYFKLGNIRKSELFDDKPFRVDLQLIDDSVVSVICKVTDINKIGAKIELENAKDKVYDIKWGEWFLVKGAKIRFIKLFEELPANSYLFIYSPVESATAEIASNLSVNSLNSRTTIINLSIKAKNPRKASAILDAIVEQYNEQNIEDKSLVLNKTIDFISQRLNVVSEELGVAESDIKNFKQSNQLIDLQIQTEQEIGQKKDIENSIVQNKIQRKLYEGLLDNFHNLKVGIQILPVNFGLVNKELNQLIEQYNLLVIRRNRELSNAGENSLNVTDLMQQIKSVHQSLEITLLEFGRTLEVQEQEVNKQKQKLYSYINKMPSSEKAFVEIRRQQAVKEGLYLYLLQKREEYAISSSATISNYKQIDPASGSTNPFEPKSSKIYLIAMIIGIVLPFIIIYIVDLFDDKVNSIKDVSSVTQMTILAEIGHSTANNENKLVVINKSRDVLSEEFRILRANLNFILHDKKVILVTSSMPGEGKSFVAINLAAVLAISNKKVALLEFDLRKPGIVKSLGLDRKNIGLSTFLSNQNSDLESMYYELEGYPTLHVYGSGPIPPNPSELIMFAKTNELIEKLQTKYEYIIIDTAPIGLVSDPFNLMKHVDATLYVVRQRKTFKKSLLFLNELYTNGQLSNGSIVLNDVKVGGRYGYYGRNYSYSTYGGYGYRGSRSKEYSEYFDKKSRITWWDRIKKKFNKA